MKILVVNTKGQTNQEITTSAKNWGELKKEFPGLGIQFTNSMKAMIGETMMTLESSGAILPSYDFTLFLTPMNVKNGGYSYQECRKRIKFFIERDMNAKEHFGNYTILSTDAMNDLISTYICPDKVEETEGNFEESIDKIIEDLTMLKSTFKNTKSSNEKAKMQALLDQWENIKNTFDPNFGYYAVVPK